MNKYGKHLTFEDIVNQCIQEIGLPPVDNFSIELGEEKKKVLLKADIISGVEMPYRIIVSEKGFKGMEEKDIRDELKKYLKEAFKTIIRPRVNMEQDVKILIGDV